MRKITADACKRNYIQARQTTKNRRRFKIKTLLQHLIKGLKTLLQHFIKGSDRLEEYKCNIPGSTNIYGTLYRIMLFASVLFGFISLAYSMYNIITDSFEWRILAVLMAPIGFPYLLNRIAILSLPSKG